MSLNLATLSKRLDIPERTIKGKLENAGHNVLNGSPIPANFVAFVCQEYKKPRANRSSKTNRAAKDILSTLSAGDIGAAEIATSNTEELDTSWTTAEIVAVLPLPLVGLVAAYGVWSLAGYFVPAWMQWVEAVAIESVYISLAALTNINAEQKELAKRVSFGALAISVVYGSLAACFHTMPNLYESFNLAGKIALAVLHGAPFPLIAYSISNLLLHRKK